ncbi:hypothetical protein BH11ARM2_BH11ARM2_10110 [soil metagenome]
MMERAILITKRTRQGRERGQTIIVALIILGLLLILGFVFIGIINRSIQSGARTLTRTRANDVAEAGIRYAQRQLLQSEEGADWRGTPTFPVAEATQPNFTRDPDAFYLRPGTGLAFPGTNQPDLGGPDGLGPYVRVGFDADRALVRVSYTPSDFNLFSSDPRGSLRNPGALRNYLLLESVGRSGRVDTGDPTTLGTSNPVQFRGFTTATQLAGAVRQFQAAQAGARTTRVSRALVPIGITDYARFITNKFKVSRAAELGIPDDIANIYGGTAPTLQIGTANLDKSNLGIASGVIGLGGIRANGDLNLTGNIQIYGNRLFGDQFDVAGSLKGDGATLNLTTQNYSFDGTGNIQWAAPLTAQLNDTQLDSRSSSFSTDGGFLRDGMAATDDAGYSRGLGYLDPPSTLTQDPDTKETRYLGMTRESGVLTGSGNSGRYGHGGGVYVDNVSDRQTARTESGRAVPSSRSLVQDWTDPNNRDSSGWNGPFYMPRGAYLTLQNDGFTIVRDARGNANERVWRTYDGTATGNTGIRYRIGRGTDGSVRIVDGFTPGITDINGALAASDYDKGFVLSGVLYFEGNVRVRGVIPTDMQLNVVSGATIYIEGSITKGVVGNALTTPGINIGARLNRPSRSMIALLAKDWVTVNTTMLFGPAPGTQPETVNDEPGLGLTPVRMGTGTDLRFQSEFVLAPPTDDYAASKNPSGWLPMPLVYRDTAGQKMGSELLLTHTSADQATDRSYISLAVNPGLVDTPANIRSLYYFPSIDANAATVDLNQPAPFPMYGLGVEAWQRYPKFETASFPFVSLIGGNTATVTPDGSATDVNATFGNYRFLNSGTNEFVISPEAVNGHSTNDYLLSRAALVPGDVKIEALIYAEEGSFFVIPGQWFNTNPNDLRSAFITRRELLVQQGLSLADAGTTAEIERQRDFGNGPSTPFYGEPIDVKINISGSVNENMPPPMAQQAEWLRKWGWIPGTRGTAGFIPVQHADDPATITATNGIVPNLVMTYDPVLATGRTLGFSEVNRTTQSLAGEIVRTDAYGRTLPPVPRLPVSPALAYFGDLN